MKRFFINPLILILLVVLSSSFLFAKERAVYPKYQIKILKESTFDSQIISIANKNEPLNVIGDFGDWYKIKNKQGMTGWVASMWVIEDHEVNQKVQEQETIKELGRETKKLPDSDIQEGKMGTIGMAILVIWIISAVITWFIAKKKGQSIGGFITGCIFGPFGIIIALLSSIKKRKNHISEISKIKSQNDDNDIVKTLKGSPVIKKIVISVIGFLVAISLFYSPGLRLSILDDNTDTFFSEAIKKAGFAYATCRLLNASVSVVQNSNIAIEPAGVGVSLALGQVLDPINDMTERVSDILVTSITSLGVQKLAYEITVSLAPSMLAVLLLIASILLWFKNEKIVSMRKLLMKIILLIIIARFALPVSAIANNYLQENFFIDKISEAKKELSLGSAELDKLKEFSLPKIDGIRGTIKNSTSFIKRKSIEFKNAVVSTVSNAGNIIDNLLKLSFLYVGVFIIQVIALPLLAFWILVKLVNSLFDTNIPVILQHSKIVKGKTIQQNSTNDAIKV